MAVIALVGPHAVGKTTAARRWAARYSNLKVVHCDGDKQVNIPGRVVLLEGCSAHANQWIDKVAVDWVIHAYCAPELLRQNMKLRCEAKGKTFRDDYWDNSKLVYESYHRMNNLLSRLGLKHSDFLVADRQTDWRNIDLEFGTLYRTYNNRK